MKTLTELANFYKSDKGNEYKCAHHYTLHYEQLFAPIKDREVALLEIGLNRDDSSDIPSLRMYEQYFKKVQITGFDINSEFFKFNENGRKIIIGDQSRAEDLQQCHRHRYDIVIDDGSHASSHQQITLRELWQTVAPGGYYIIEDLHWQPFQEQCPKTVELARAWQEGIAMFSEYIATANVETILKETESFSLLPSYSSLHDSSLTAQALLVIKKKS